MINIPISISLTRNGILGTWETGGKKRGTSCNPTLRRSEPLRLSEKEKNKVKTALNSRCFCRQGLDSAI